jgi:hypothetical protein
MLNEKLKAYEELNGEPLKKLPDSYDDFALAVIEYDGKLILLYNAASILDELEQNAGLNEEEAAEVLQEMVANHPDIAFLGDFLE